MPDIRTRPAVRDQRFEAVLQRLSRDAAALQAFRRAAREEPGSTPRLWPYVWTADSRHDDDVAADHHTMVLFAYHQQSKVDDDRALVHRSGAGSIAHAARALVLDAGKVRSDAAVTRRVQAAATANSLTELVWHLRGVVTLLGRQIPLDYSELRRDLRQWMWPDGPAQVRRRWGRDFYLSQTDRSTDASHDITDTTIDSQETQ